MNCSRKCIVNYCGNYSFYNYNCLNIDLVMNGYPITTVEIIISFFVLGTWCLIFCHWRRLNKRIRQLEKQKIKIV